MGIFHREGYGEATWVLWGWWELLLKEGFRDFPPGRVSGSDVDVSGLEASREGRIQAFFTGRDIGKRPGFCWRGFGTYCIMTVWISDSYMSGKIQSENIYNKESFMGAPNFFSDAPESLQDAFIRWLVECATESTNPLYECGLAFVRALFQAGASAGTKGIPVLDSDGKRMDPYNGRYYVSEVSTPRRQYLNIDVYFQARVDGKKVSFILEDKTDSEPHGNQLKRYLKDVINDEREEDLIKPIYFKTGYVFNYERDVVEENKYFLFEAKDLKKFLVGHPDAIRENQILRQYAEYLDNLITERCKAQSEWCLNYAHVQWEFMRKLRKVLRNANGSTLSPTNFPREEPDYREPDEWRWKGLERGNNLNSKSPWTLSTGFQSIFIGDSTGNRGW